MTQYFTEEIHRPTTDAEKAAAYDKLEDALRWFCYKMDDDLMGMKYDSEGGYFEIQRHDRTIGESKLFNRLSLVEEFTSALENARDCVEKPDTTKANNPDYNYGQNYRPNENHWSIGDIVIHDADAKNEYMLMRVVGYGKNHKIRTKYITSLMRETKMPGKQTDHIFENYAKYLHDPEIFGISHTDYTIKFLEDEDERYRKEQETNKVKNNK